VEVIPANSTNSSILVIANILLIDYRVKSTKIINLPQRKIMILK